MIFANSGTGVDVTGALNTLTTVFSSALELITSNPIMLIFFASGLLGIGFGLVRRARRAAGSSN